VLRGFGLHDHRADAAGDHGVELAGDARSFVGDRQELATLALGRDPLRLAPELLVQQPARAQSPSDGPGHRHDAGRERIVARSAGLWLVRGDRIRRDDRQQRRNDERGEVRERRGHHTARPIVRHA
jgi:hypothetical protein